MSLKAFKMYYVMRTFAPSLHRKSTDFLIRRENEFAQWQCTPPAEQDTVLLYYYT